MKLSLLAHANISMLDLSKRSCIYISGQMSGLEDLGKKELDKMENSVREAGFLMVMNPYYMVDQEKKLTWADCMVIDIKDIMNYGVRAAFLLDNWIESKGATLEVILFLALGIPLFDKNGNNITQKVFEQFTPEFLHQKFVAMIATHEF